MLTDVLDRLKEKFNDAIISSEEFRGETTIHVRKEKITDVCWALHNDPVIPFDYLSDLCGADTYEGDQRFEVIYNIYSLAAKQRLRLVIRTDEEDMHIPSVTSVWPGAEWPERETYDMFGIIFDGHPDLRRMYMPEEFEHFPLRKDFPLMGIPGSLQLPRK
jgi:NADH-quinone oxidoreductase subunit C